MTNGIVTAKVYRYDPDEDLYPTYQTYEVPCEVYEARKVMVYDRNHDKLVKQADIDCNGHYRVELEPGEYAVDINRIGIDHSSEVPTTVEIAPGDTVTLDIDIDTGIR